MQVDEGLIRRARPLLGTIVEIGIRHPSRESGLEAISTGFAAIEEVHRLMNFHDAESDVGRLNRAEPGAAVKIHPWTFEVLSLATRICTESSGAFDVSTGPFKLVHGFMARRSKDAAIDLSGIAKGYAVDRAVEALKERGVESGVINAGGDLAVFGAEPFPVSVRTPADPGTAVPFAMIQNGAAASSGNYFRSGAIIDRRTGTSVKDDLSITVIADCCAIADALTKAVFVMGRDAAPVLEAFGAAAWQFRGSATDLQITPLSDNKCSSIFELRPANED